MDSLSEKTRHLEGYLNFNYLDAAFIVGAIFTYAIDLGFDIGVGLYYLFQKEYVYAGISLFLALVPTFFVQLFSARWHQMDKVFNKSYWAFHSMGLGMIHRYILVLLHGVEAMNSGDPLDYQRFYQQQSDVCMLRLFDSFTESAPQLVFHLYVMLQRRSDWSDVTISWTAMSAVASVVSLGWGVAAYSSAMRMSLPVKSKLTYAGMFFQTLWRFGMIAARLVSLVLLSLALQEMTFVAIFFHWLLMTSWVVWQDTDFCATWWEERIYNAVVGVIYCFTFFNLKEGKSRYRAGLFYAVVIVENYACLFLFNAMWSPLSPQPDDTFANFDDGSKLTADYSLAAICFVTAGTTIGLASMMIYYRFFHPAGPIKPCPVRQSVDFKTPDLTNQGFEPDSNDNHVDNAADANGPSFVIEFTEDNGQANQSTSTKNETASPINRKTSGRGALLKHSRSFKTSCSTRQHQSRHQHLPPPSPVLPPKPTAPPGSQDNSPGSYGVGVPSGMIVRPPVDSAYGTDSNRTASRSTASPSTGTTGTIATSVGNGVVLNSTAIHVHEVPVDCGGLMGPHGHIIHPPQPHSSNVSAGGGAHHNNSSGNHSLNSSGGASVAFQNETYMSYVEKANVSNNNTYQSVRAPSEETVIYKPSASTATSVTTSNSAGKSVTPPGGQKPKSHTALHSNQGSLGSSSQHQSDNYKRLLKRSPIVKDVTTGFAQISSTDRLTSAQSLAESKASSLANTCTTSGNQGSKLNPPLTILIPNISHHAIARRSTSNLQGRPESLKAAMEGSYIAPPIESSRRQSSSLSDKTIPLEVLNPNLLNEASLTVNPSTSFHDYENLALININRNAYASQFASGGGGESGVRHWKTYSDMAEGVHDESVSCDRSKTKRNVADYSSIHYFDIYPLSKELKEQLYRSITPISTAATMATSDATFNSNNTSSNDTYEPIETYALDAQPNAQSRPEHQNLNGGKGGFSESVNTTLASQASTSAPVPAVTLIHHDGNQVSTVKQIVSMEGLKEILHKHEKVKLDDPQDRGDLYLLAPMRLLTPILEEEETLSSQIGGETGEGGFNRSVMTVISELLTNHSKSMQIYQSLSETRAVSQMSHWTDGGGQCPDGRFPDSVESASSTLVSTIEEIRNNQSISNLYYLNGSNGESPGATAGPQVATGIRSKRVMEACYEKHSFQTIPEEPSEVEQSSAATITRERSHALNSSVKSIKSNTLIPSPSKVESRSHQSKVTHSDSQLKSAIRQPLADVESNSSQENVSNNNYCVKFANQSDMFKKPLATSVSSLSVKARQEDGSKSNVSQKKSPLYACVGTRRNIVNLTLSDENILNTPNRSKPSETANVLQSKQSKSNLYSDLGQQTIFDAEIKATVSSDSESDSDVTSNGALSSSHGFLDGNTIVRSSGVKSGALSPSSKYSQNTPTPPTKPFVRNYNQKLPRRKFNFQPQTSSSSIQAPVTKQMITAKRKSYDLYENISDEYLELRNSMRLKSKTAEVLAVTSKCRSVPSILDEANPEAGHYDVPPAPRRNNWNYGSFQNPAPSVNISSRNSNYRRSMSALLDEKENNHPPDQLCHPAPRALAQRVPDKPAHLRLKPIDPNVGHYDVPKARAFNTSNLCNVGTKNRMNW